MSGDQKEYIDNLSKYLRDKGMLVYTSDEIIDDIKDYAELVFKKNIFLPVKYLDKLDIDQKLAILNASYYSDIKDVVKAKHQYPPACAIMAGSGGYYTSSWSIYNSIKACYPNIPNIDDYVIVAISPAIISKEEAVAVYFFTLAYTRIFKAKHGLSHKIEHSLLPTFCLKDLNEVDTLSKKAIYFEYNIRNVLDTLRRRYQLNADNVNLTNEITDKSTIYSIMDKNILRSLKDLDGQNAEYNKNMVILNPNMSFFAESINKTMPIQHLLALFDIDEKEFKTTMKKVSYLTNPIVSLGLGGLMSNFLYWTDRLRDYYELDYVFKQLIVFEPDELEFSNLFRIPLDWKNYKIPTNIEHKQMSLFIDCFDDYANQRKEHLFGKINLLKSVRNLSPKIRQYPQRFRNIDLKHSIIIGAPDLDTRKRIFSKYADNNRDQDISFICATHSDNNVSISSFPDFDRELVVETYGSVDLNKFMLNMFKMTTEILKILANGDYKDKFAHNLLDYSVDNEDFKANSQKHKCLKNIVYAYN